MSIEAVLSGKTLPSKEFCKVLMDEVKNRHARLYHPFYLDLYEGKLPIEAVRIWAKEAWGIFEIGVANFRMDDIDKLFMNLRIVNAGKLAAH